MDRRPAIAGFYRFTEVYKSAGVGIEYVADCTKVH
jgi:hypothetical protein